MMRVIRAQKQEMFFMPLWLYRSYKASENKSDVEHNYSQSNHIKEICTDVSRSISYPFSIST